MKDASKTETCFWEKVDNTDDYGCWPWRGCRSPKGYGYFKYKGKPTPAHRVAFQIAIAKRDLRTSEVVCHKCDNPSCCNPSHLFLGTQKDNIEDMAKKGRGHWQTEEAEERRASKRPRKFQFAILDESQVLEIRNLYEHRDRNFTDWRSVQDIASSFGVSTGAIRGIIKGKTWAWLP